MRVEQLMLGMVMLALAAGGARADEAETPGPGAPWEEFALIARRNIFDSERRPMRAARADSATTQATEVASEAIDLLGVFMEGEAQVAFAESAGSVRTLRLGEKLGGWRIARIDTARLRLSKGEESLDWPVGARLERRGEGAWRVAERTPVVAATAVESAPAGGGREEILQRMLERRRRGASQ